MAYRKVIGDENKISERESLLLAYIIEKKC